MLLAQTYARRKNSAAALAAASQSEKLGSRDPEVFRGLAFLFTDLQPDLNRAASLAERYAELQPSDKTAWRRVAAMYLVAGQYDRAILTGARGLAVDDSQELHTVLGQAYQGKQDWQHAAEQLSAAVKLGSYDENAHFLLIQMYLGHEDFAHASEAIADARKIFARSPQIELAAGVCAYGLRHFPEAVDQFLKTIALAPDVPQSYLFLARIFDQASDLVCRRWWSVSAVIATSTPMTPKPASYMPRRCSRESLPVNFHRRRNRPCNCWSTRGRSTPIRPTSTINSVACSNVNTSMPLPPPTWNGARRSIRASPACTFNWRVSMSAWAGSRTPPASGTSTRGWPTLLTRR